MIILLFLKLKRNILGLWNYLWKWNCNFCPKYFLSYLLLLFKKNRFTISNLPSNDSFEFERLVQFPGQAFPPAAKLLRETGFGRWNQARCDLPRQRPVCVICFECFCSNSKKFCPKITQIYTVTHSRTRVAVGARFQWNWVPRRSTWTAWFLWVPAWAIGWKWSVFSTECFNPTITALWLPTTRDSALVALVVRITFKWRPCLTGDDCDSKSVEILMSISVSIIN